MPHKCVKCENVYNDDAPEAMKGCKCGSKVFLYVKKEKLAQQCSITSSREGNYEVNIPWLFRRKQQTDERLFSPADGTYEIDLDAAFNR